MQVLNRKMTMGLFLLRFNMLCTSKQIRITLGLNLSDSFNLLRLHIKLNC